MMRNTRAYPHTHVLDEADTRDKVYTLDQTHTRPDTHWIVHAYSMRHTY